MCLKIMNHVGVVLHLLIDFNPVELNNYSLLISLDKCNRSCNAFDDLYIKTCVPSETKGVEYLL